MKATKYIFLLTFFALGLQICAAQDFQGKAIYQSKTSFDMDFEGREMSEDMKQRIRERMKSQLERTFELTFDRFSSLFVQEEKLEAPGGGGANFRFVTAGNGQGKLFKDIQNKSYTNQNEMFGKLFLIKDSLPDWEWKLSTETKKIGNYTCYKATAIRTMGEDAMNRMRRMFRRGGQNGSKKDSVATSQNDSTSNNSILARIEQEQEREIVAWYTPEIPIGQGPSNYWGLPGLILEVNDGRTALLCSKLVLNAQEKMEIVPPSKGKKVSQEEYDEILAKKMEEMQERFQGGERRGNGNRIMIRG